MFRRVLFFSQLLLAACASGDARAGDRSGRLVLSRDVTGQQALLDLPATARYCDRDSTLTVVAAGDAWAAAVAMRSAWPVDTAASFAVGTVLGAAGSGAVAARPLADTSLSVLIGGSGTITVSPGAMLAGRISVDVPRDSGAVIHLTGRFEDLAVRMNGCP